MDSLYFDTFGDDVDEVVPRRSPEEEAAEARSRAYADATRDSKQWPCKNCKGKPPHHYCKRCKEIWIELHGEIMAENSNDDKDPARDGRVRRESSLPNIVTTDESSDSSHQNDGDWFDGWTSPRQLTPRSPNTRYHRDAETDFSLGYAGSYRGTVRTTVQDVPVDYLASAYSRRGGYIGPQETLYLEESRILQRPGFEPHNWAPLPQDWNAEQARRLYSRGDDDATTTSTTTTTTSTATIAATPTIRHNLPIWSQEDDPYTAAIARGTHSSRYRPPYRGRRHHHPPYTTTTTATTTTTVHHHHPKKPRRPRPPKPLYVRPRPHYLLDILNPSTPLAFPLHLISSAGHARSVYCTTRLRSTCHCLGVYALRDPGPNPFDAFVDWLAEQQCRNRLLSRTVGMMAAAMGAAATVTAVAALVMGQGQGRKGGGDRREWLKWTGTEIAVLLLTVWWCWPLEVAETFRTVSAGFWERVGRELGVERLDNLDDVQRDEDDE